jgi:arylsulfatase
VFTTLANATGASLPDDRALDGVNQLSFFRREQSKSRREGFPIFIGTEIRAVKWQDWKLHYAWQDEHSGQPIQPVMKLFNLRSDPKEETDVKDVNPWVASAAGRIVSDFEATLKRFPLIPIGTPDPYVPPSR